MASFADIFNMPVGQGGITWAQLLGIASQSPTTKQLGTAELGTEKGQTGSGMFSLKDFFTPASGQRLLYNTAPTVRPAKVPQLIQQPVQSLSYYPEVQGE